MTLQSQPYIPDDNFHPIQADSYINPNRQATWNRINCSKMTFAAKTVLSTYTSSSFTIFWSCADYKLLWSTENNITGSKCCLHAMQCQFHQKLFYIFKSTNLLESHLYLRTPFSWSYSLITIWHLRLIVKGYRTSSNIFVWTNSCIYSDGLASHNRAAVGP